MLNNNSNSNSQTQTPNAKQRIITTASNLFFHVGYEVTGVNEIIDKSDVSKATLYKYFKSKEELCVVCLRRRDQSVMQIFNYITSTKGDDPVDKIKSIYEYVKNSMERTNYVGCPFQNMLAEQHALNELAIKTIKEHKRNIHIMFKNILEATEGDDFSYQTATDIEKTARKLQLVYEGSYVVLKLEKNSDYVKTAVELSGNIVSEFFK